MTTTTTKKAKKQIAKPERDWVDALMISNRKGGDLGERIARLTPAQRDAMVAELRLTAAEADPTPAKSEPTEAEHELLRKEIVDWYISAKAMIDHLYTQTCSMKHELKKNPDSPLAIWLNEDEMSALSSLLEEASCKIADIPPPLPFPIADPMDVVLSIRATSKKGGQS